MSQILLHAASPETLFASSFLHSCFFSWQKFSVSKVYLYNHFVFSLIACGKVDPSKKSRGPQIYCQTSNFTAKAFPKLRKAIMYLSWKLHFCFPNSSQNDSSARPQTAFLNSLTATDLPGSWLLALGFLAPGFLAPGSRLPGSWLPGSWLLAWRPARAPGWSIFAWKTCGFHQNFH